ncbi:MAG: apolipoprotein N-acyltransferase [Bacteroidetes bacterium]|nr:apolipoprotein N-acyltransferase [Bacteroidota bacterium]
MSAESTADHGTFGGRGRTTYEIVPRAMDSLVGKKQRIILALASGTLFALAFPPVPTGMTAFAALLPLLFLIEGLPDWRAVFRWSYLTFLIANIGTIWWVSGWWGDDHWLKVAGVAVNLIHPLLFTIPAIAYFFLRRRMGATFSIVSFPLLWTTWEWLMHLPELSFPWLLLANTQTYDIMSIQFITATGAFGISFWIASINALLFHMLRRWLSDDRRLRFRPYLPGVTVFLLLLLLPRLHGMLVMNDTEQTRPHLRIAVLQPDVDPYDKWGKGETPMGKLRHLIALYDSVAAFRPDLALLPETAIPFRLLQASWHEEYSWLRTHLDSVGIPLLSGFPHTVYYDDEQTAPTSARRIKDTDIRYQDFNAALLLQPGERMPQIYRKSRLTPLSERIPYLDALPFLQDALTWGVGISNWGLGNDTTVFSLRQDNGEAGIWAMICYETLYPSFVAGFSRRGANVFGVITNDGWFGRSSGPYQLMQYTVLRAIENRRAVARCANNGISCFIDPYGRVYDRTTLYTRTAIVRDLPLRSDITFYARYGDWLPMAISVLTGFIFLFAFISGRYKT